MFIEKQWEWKVYRKREESSQELTIVLPATWPSLYKPYRYTYVYICDVFLLMRACECKQCWSSAVSRSQSRVLIHCVLIIRCLKSRISRFLSTLNPTHRNLYKKKLRRQTAVLMIRSLSLAPSSCCVGVIGLVTRMKCVSKAFALSLLSHPQRKFY